MIIQRAESDDQLRHVRALISAYIAEQGAILGIDFGPKLHSIRDLEDPAGVYAPPGGCILVATEGIQTVGCVALQWVDPVVGEMKRLYVRPPLLRATPLSGTRHQRAGNTVHGCSAPLDRAGGAEAAGVPLAHPSHRYNGSHILSSHCHGGVGWNCAIVHSATCRVPRASR